ncbi:MAG: DUF934 domain-containing protein [Alphaproteobacteria bacterium]|nr:DUF934 domain-containing protein [Alphaproteobacteria bacterium]
MPLIRNGQMADDSFVKVGADTPLPEGDVIVPFARLLAEAETLLARNARLGVLVSPGEDVDALKPHLPRLALVALAFPAFRDGRAYSSARLLRTRYGFTGEIRAVGNVLRDQLFFMARVGIDAFEVEKAGDAAGFSAALGEFSHVYQPSTDGRRPVFALRHAVARAAAE